MAVAMLMIMAVAVVAPDVAEHEVARQHFDCRSVDEHAGGDARHQALDEVHADYIIYEIRSSSML